MHCCSNIDADYFLASLYIDIIIIRIKKNRRRETILATVDLLFNCCEEGLFKQ